MVMWSSLPSRKFSSVTWDCCRATQSHVSRVCSSPMCTPIMIVHYIPISDLFRETLPLSGPSTYRGKSIRYSYKITIATQKVGSKVQVLRLPIRVLSLPTTIRPDEIPALCNETSDELSPTNPFLENRKSAETKLEIALHHLQNTTARRRPNFYLISNKRGRVGRFCLFKQNFKLGEDIVGTLDFSSRTVRCVQVSVTLQCEESLVRSVASAAAINSTGADAVKTADGKAIDADNARIMNFTKHHEVCLGLMQTQMILPVPLHVTPTFQTGKGRFAAGDYGVARANFMIARWLIIFVFFSIFHCCCVQYLCDGVCILNLSPRAMIFMRRTVVEVPRTAIGKHRMTSILKLWCGICRWRCSQPHPCKRCINRPSTRWPSNEWGRRRLGGSFAEGHDKIIHKIKRRKMQSNLFLYFWIIIKRNSGALDPY